MKLGNTLFTWNVILYLLYIAQYLSQRLFFVVVFRFKYITNLRPKFSYLMLQ